MLSQEILDATETQPILGGQFPLGRTSQEICDEPLYLVIRQPVSYAPYARGATG